MATFNTKKILYGSSALIPAIASRIQEEFQNEGYEVAMDALSSGGYDISITKGGVFKAILGMKTALKVTLLPQDENINFEAGVGIWGQQAIPTVISMLFFWPVLITQIWGMVEQSKLDDKALDIARDVIYMSNAKSAGSNAGSNHKFCTNCGTENSETAKFCNECGKLL
ncbi:zinc ribbon domain-containing protein [Bacteroides caecigallinarum]|uniref:zinc ribbon domain-containing protein n=1 Tax=Bacteroides caecigallinarum TaxID=1411144 RepID=UPI00195C095E|nr:zinc ribbon domain-containing protein [Bacteroides caecigallinarum]MBM6890246.1 zinc ribbon domain-containing protein [Bacteroides caecigallinarum]MCF2553359.1 zinc ribbon domain-containing protein [Bacteroides caecigallinarum]